MIQFEDKKNTYRSHDLHKLHKLQMTYCGSVDMSIETRKDMRVNAISFCNYGYMYTEKSKLYVHKLSWDKDNTEEINEIEKELEKLYLMPAENTANDSAITLIPASKHFIDELKTKE